MRWARLWGFAPPATLLLVGVVGVAAAVGADGIVPEELDVLLLLLLVGVVPPAAAGVVEGALLAVDKADTTVDCCPSEFLVALR